MGVYSIAYEENIWPWELYKYKICGTDYMVITKREMIWEYRSLCGTDVIWVNTTKGVYTWDPLEYSIWCIANSKIYGNFEKFQKLFRLIIILVTAEIGLCKISGSTD